MTALPSSSRARNVSVVVGGAAAITAGAWLNVPMTPVPMTLQSLAIVVFGALVPRVLSLTAIALYVTAALAGLPVLAEFTRAPGADFFALKSSGYVFGFFAGALVARNMLRTPSPFAQFAWALLAHAAILACGVTRLAYSLGFEAAVEHGLTPFVLGAIVKSAVAVLIVRWAPRLAALTPREHG